jgi:hypothetical protein
MLEQDLNFKLLFDIDISGTVESMYGSSEKERDTIIQHANGDDDGDGDGDDGKKKSYSAGRTCTSETILHAYTMSV